MVLFKMRKTKRLALECIMLSMEEIKANLENTSDENEVKANVEAMNQLAKSFEIVWRA